jgi:2-phospho-L-lactate/phosphoenolpyruvate guanylyltransferase
MGKSNLPWLLIPVRSLRFGKSRLTPPLSESERVALNEYFLSRTLRIAKDAEIDRVAVVSDGMDTLHLASTLGAHTIHQAEGDLNDAISLGIENLRDISSSGTLIIPVDLAWMNGSDLRQLIYDFDEKTILVCPDQARDGTNALFVPARSIFQFCFGPKSFFKHQQAARLRGYSVVTHFNDRIARDVDVPSDLHDLHCPFLVHI